MVTPTEALNTAKQAADRKELHITGMVKGAVLGAGLGLIAAMWTGKNKLTLAVMGMLAGATVEYAFKKNPDAARIIGGETA